MPGATVELTEEQRSFGGGKGPGGAALGRERAPSSVPFAEYGEETEGFSCDAIHGGIVCGEQHHWAVAAARVRFAP